MGGYRDHGGSGLATDPTKGADAAAAYAGGFIGKDDVFAEGLSTIFGVGLGNVVLERGWRTGRAAGPPHSVLTDQRLLNQTIGTGKHTTRSRTL